MWFYHSKDDATVPEEYDVKAAAALDDLKAKYGPFDFTWKRYDDIGHGLPKDGVKPIVDWMLKKTRNPNPKHVLWKGGGDKRLFYWLKRSKPGGLVEAKIEGNTIDLTGDVDNLELLLSDKLVKLSDPVIVKVDGKEVRSAKLRPSIVALVESAARNDPEMIATARVKP